MTRAIFVFALLLVTGCSESGPSSDIVIDPGGSSGPRCNESTKSFDYADIQGQWVLTQVRRGRVETLEPFWTRHDSFYRNDRSYFNLLLSWHIGVPLIKFLEINDKNLSYPVRHMSGAASIKEKSFIIDNGWLCSQNHRPSDDLMVVEVSESRLIIDGRSLIFPRQQYLYEKVEPRIFEKVKQMSLLPKDQLITDYEATETHLEVESTPFGLGEDGHLRTCSLLEDGLRVAAFETGVTNNSSREYVVRLAENLRLHESYETKRFNIRKGQLPVIEVRTFQGGQSDRYLTDIDESNCKLTMKNREYMVSGRLQCRNLGFFHVKNVSMRTLKLKGKKNLDLTFKCNLTKLINTL